MPQAPRDAFQTAFQTATGASLRLISSMQEHSPRRVAANAQGFLSLSLRTLPTSKKLKSCPALGHLQAAKALDGGSHAAKALEEYQAAIHFYLLHLQTPELDQQSQAEASKQASSALDRAEVLKSAVCSSADKDGQQREQTSGVHWPSTSIKQTAEHLRRAVLADRAGDILAAIAAYKQGLALLMDRLEWEQDPAARAGITYKAEQYLERTRLLISLSHEADTFSHIRQDEANTSTYLNQPPADMAVPSAS